jgi:hypothetical protein
MTGEIRRAVSVYSDMLGLESIRNQSQLASTFCLENDLRSRHFSSDNPAVIPT